EDNSRFVEVVKTPVHDHAGATIGMQGVFWDVTDRKRTEEALQEKSEQLARSNEALASSNQDLQQFAYVASHDLQEPLRMVSSYCQLLEKRYKGRLDEQADEYIHYAVDGAQRMQQLINDLLVFSRVESRAKPFQPSELRQAVEIALANLRSSVEESGADIRCGPLPRVMGDRSQLAQLFQNLIGNALKFQGEERAIVEVEAARSGREWVICVRDNGIGIPDEQRDRIFDLFRRLHARTEYPGTGIGLAVCKKVVERHQGRLWVESDVDEGSRFYFSLPASDIDPERPA
ncbi:MAG: ATP-binding protein, partial [Phycisphaerae bacterium]|nr:ATP-binding protein [Phycisphaerae bacterium]